MNNRNSKKFVQFYDSNLDAIYRFCYVRTNNAELSKDLAQQSFLKTWVYVKTKEEEINVRALVYRIARNLIIDWYRKNKEVSLEALTDEGFDPASDEYTDTNINTELSLKILYDLSEYDKELITLRFVDCLKPKEISKIVKKNVNSVSAGITRAKSRLKKIIKDKKYDI